MNTQILEEISLKLQNGKTKDMLATIAKTQAIFFFPLLIKYSPFYKY